MAEFNKESTIQDYMDNIYTPETPTAADAIPKPETKLVEDFKPKDPLGEEPENKDKPLDGKQEAETPVETPAGEKPATPTEEKLFVKFGEKEFTESQIQTYIESGLRSDDYNEKIKELKSASEALTEIRTKAASIVDTDSQLKPLVDAIKKDSSLYDTIRSSIVESLGDTGGKLLDDAITFDPTGFKHPLEEKITAFEERDRVRTQELAQSKELDDAMVKYKLTTEGRKRIEAFQYEQYDKTKRLLDADQAYLMLKGMGDETVGTKSQLELIGDNPKPSNLSLITDSGIGHKGDPEGSPLSHPGRQGDLEYLKEYEKLTGQGITRK